jgi:hypothetical protein
VVAFTRESASLATPTVRVCELRLRTRLKRPADTLESTAFTR